MSLPPSELPPRPTRPTLLRVVIWVVVGGIGVALVVVGVLGIIARGG